MFVKYLTLYYTCFICNTIKNIPTIIHYIPTKYTTLHYLPDVPLRGLVIATATHIGLQYIICSTNLDELRWVASLIRMTLEN